MRRMMAAMTAATIGGAVFSPFGSAMAQSNLVVVELYTSQGCSSCPPADSLLTELTEQEDVLPLALHVDYWDYIGWKDMFADPQFTKRQKAYAYAAGKHTIYTPQMIVGGKDHVVGFKPMHLAKLIETQAKEQLDLNLTVTREGDSVQIAAPAYPDLGESVVQLVRYMPETDVDIGRGENAGRTITYSNVVTSWQVLDTWDGSQPLEITSEVTGEEPVVVLIQREGPKSILAAARLR